MLEKLIQNINTENQSIYLIISTIDNKDLNYNDSFYCEEIDQFLLREFHSIDMALNKANQVINDTKDLTCKLYDHNKNFIMEINPPKN